MMYTKVNNYTDKDSYEENGLTPNIRKSEKWLTPLYECLLVCVLSGIIIMFSNLRCPRILISEDICVINGKQHLSKSDKFDVGVLKLYINGQKEYGIIYFPSPQIVQEQEKLQSIITYKGSRENIHGEVISLHTLKSHPDICVLKILFHESGMISKGFYHNLTNYAHIIIKDKSRTLFDMMTEPFRNYLSVIL